MPPKKKSDAKKGDGSKKQDSVAKVASVRKLSTSSSPHVETSLPAFLHHLPKRKSLSSQDLKVNFGREEVHPAIIRLGHKFSKREVSGANARCVAMLLAIVEVINDFVTPPKKHISRVFVQMALSPCINHLVSTQPMSVGMGNAIRGLRSVISSLNPALPEADCREKMLEYVHDFIEDYIQKADVEICKSGASSIRNGDVIATFANSYVVTEMLKLAHEQGKQFRVVVLDSRPWLEGKHTLRALLKHGIECTYGHIDAASYLMKEVTKVFVGAHGIMNNGVVISRVGTASVAMIARAFNVPVIVCCEIYKFSDRVVLDDFCRNEIADPTVLMETTASGAPVSNPRPEAKYKVLNIVYDVTPIQYVSMVITEIGKIPPTAAPVISREYKEMTVKKSKPASTHSSLPPHSHTHTIDEESPVMSP